MFEVKFKGVRGSYPVCKNNFLKYGGNTASVQILCGSQIIILDCGTGIVDIGEEILKNNVLNSTIFITHLHLDHIQGLPFYKPLFDKNSTVNLFGPNIQKIKSILFENAFPLAIDELDCNFKINDLTKESVIFLNQKGELTKEQNSKDDIKFSFYKAIHPKNGSLNIKIEFKNKTLVYATDTEQNTNDINFINFIKDCDCLIHDSQYTFDDYKKGYGHSTFNMAIETAKKANAKKLFFYHYDPNYDDNRLSNLENRYGVINKYIFAKENMKIEL